ncbi:MAG: tRNA lysidine(34) synthetase TilS [Nitrososphaera sp.]|nr:tRNA lysidine(34) synthetase TilS [Nitrososphaera sp.]
MKIVGNVKDIGGVALSGGIDSMSLLDFLRADGHRNIKALYFHHGTEHGEKALDFLALYCEFHGIDLIVGEVTNEKPPEYSWEQFWSQERYKFLQSFDFEIATAHHLNDCAENYLWGMITNGNPRFIHYRKPMSNIVRPFLLVSKEEIKNRRDKRCIPWIEDPTNAEQDHFRNKIRHTLLPAALAINPGFLKMVARLYDERLAGI